MDNNKDRQFYWEVKDFMNKKENPQPSNSSKPKITDAVKNVLEQNNPYIQKSFNNRSEYIPHVQKTINIVSETEKGYEQNCKAFTKNKDVNGFQTIKNLTEAVALQSNRGYVFQPATSSSGLPSIGLAPDQSSTKPPTTKKPAQVTAPRVNDTSSTPRTSQLGSDIATAAKAVDAKDVLQLAKNVGKGTAQLGTNLGLGLAIDSVAQPVIKSGFNAIFGDAKDPNAPPGSKWNVDDSAELTSYTLSGAASGAIADAASVAVGNLLSGKALGLGMRGAGLMGGLAGAAVPVVATAGYQTGKALGQSDLVQNAVAKMYGQGDIEKTRGQTKEEIVAGAKKIQDKAKHERMYGKDDPDQVKQADLASLVKPNTGGVLGNYVELALKNPNKWLPDLSGYLPQ